MKIVAEIVEPLDPGDTSVIVRFLKDPIKQHFILYAEPRFQTLLRQGETYIVNVKWRSIVMKDLSGNKTYDTQLYTDDRLISGTELPDKRRIRT